MRLISFEKLDSTNTYSKLNIDNLDDKTVVSADFQSAGRGRFTRTWTDVGAENIYMTFVLKPSDEMKEIYANLTQYLSVCLCKELELLGLSPKIKWPNDVLLDNKKVCGILAESVIKGGKLKGIVLGIGVNLNSTVDILSQIDRPATSVNLELGRKIDKQDFMQKLISRFLEGHDEFLINGFSLIKDYYEQNSFIPLGENISVAVFDKHKTGIFRGFDDNGNLLLGMADYKIENINMGEIV